MEKSGLCTGISRKPRAKSSFGRFDSVLSCMHRLSFCQSAATDSPCCSAKIRIRPAEMKAEPVRELKYPQPGDAKCFAK